MGSWSTRRPRVAAADPWCSGNLPSSRILPALSLSLSFSGLWSLVSGLWSVVSGLWSLVFGLWSLVSGLWPLVSGLGSLVSGLWPLVPGLWSLVSLSLPLWSLVIGLSVYSAYLATLVHGAANAQRAQAASVFLRQSHGRSGFAAGAMAWRESRLPFRAGAAQSLGFVRGLATEQRRLARHAYLDCRGVGQDRGMSRFACQA